jgi:hypothetical protein
LSSIGVTKLLECLKSVNKPLDMLSIADNHLGRYVFPHCAEFLLFVIAWVTFWTEMNLQFCGSYVSEVPGFSCKGAKC